MADNYAAKAFGKLILMGEFAVLDGCSNFTIALERGVTCTFIPDGPETHLGPLTDSALNTVYSYLEESGKEVKHGSLSIANELVDENGMKIGLGSSGAIVVSVIDSVLKAYGIEPSVSLLYRLGTIAEARVQPDGSFTDIAAAACGGFFEYSPIDPDWIGAKITTDNVKDIVESQWPLVTATRYSWPEGLTLLIGWTHEESSTPNIIKKYQTIRTKYKKEHQAFTKDATQIITSFRKALDRGDSARIDEAIRNYRKCVQNLLVAVNLPLYTKKLSKLVKLAERHGAAAKPSGAWGGDCGFALCASAEQVELIKQDWLKAGITPIEATFAPAKFDI